MDSLADVISFGIAPSVLAFTWGFRPALVNSRLGWIVAFTFTICGAMRLARFNVQTGHFKHFVGLPIPAAGGTVAAIVHFVGPPLADRMAGVTMLGIVFSLALLMVSTIRYTSFKHLTFGRKSHLTILGIALLVALVYYDSQWSLLIIAAAYSLSGPVQRLLGLLHLRRPDEEASRLSHSLKTGEP